MVLRSLDLNDSYTTARDADTGRNSPLLAITINRPIPVQSAVPSAATTPVPALALSLTGPAEGTVSTDGNVIVSGTTSGSRVTIESEYLGQPGMASLLPVVTTVTDGSTLTSG